MPGSPKQGRLFEEFRVSFLSPLKKSFREFLGGLSCLLAARNLLEGLWDSTTSTTICNRNDKPTSKWCKLFMSSQGKRN